MTRRYRITNTRTGVDLGVYSADDEQGALDTMSREAGYADHEDACTVAPVEPGELLVERSPSDEPAAEPDDAGRIRELRHEAAMAGDREQMQLCDLALGGNDEALAECRRVIEAARAMGD